MNESTQSATVGTRIETVAPPDRREGVTLRVILLSFALVLLLVPVNYLIEIKWGKSYICSGVPAAMPLVMLTLLTAISAALGRTRFGRRLGMSRRESSWAVFLAVSVGVPVMTHGILFFLIPKVIGFYYQAQIKPEWSETFLSYIPLWFAPTDACVVVDFFQGQSRVPWSLWWTPPAAWLGFFVALFSCSLCLIAIVQRQWISNERLAFPLAQVPLEMVREDALGGSAPGLDALGFWLGVLLSAGAGVYNGLASRYPMIPAIPTNVIAMRQAPTGWAGRSRRARPYHHPRLIALSFLIPKELSFSCWFFWIREPGADGVGRDDRSCRAGSEHVHHGFPACFYQGAGAALALLVWVLWGGRQHLKHVSAPGPEATL